MKKAWLNIVATITVIFSIVISTETVHATEIVKTAIEQTNYEDYYFGGAIICLVLAVFTFFYKAKKYKQQIK